jgi:hypothetical protein
MTNPDDVAYLEKFESDITNVLTTWRISREVIQETVDTLVAAWRAGDNDSEELWLGVTKLANQQARAVLAVMVMALADPGEALPDDPTVRRLEQAWNEKRYPSDLQRVITRLSTDTVKLTVRRLTPIVGFKRKAMTAASN